MKALVETLTVGDPSDPSTFIGPWGADQQQRVQSYIELGIKEGARLVTGGPDVPAGLEDGCYVQPTVFADVDNNMRIAQEEIFGPVMVIIPFEDEDDAVRIANDSPYGLGGGVGRPTSSMASNRAPYPHRNGDHQRRRPRLRGPRSAATRPVGSAANSAPLA